MRIIIMLMLGLSLTEAFAQQDKFSLNQLVDHALGHNAYIIASGYEVEAQKQLKKTAIDLPKTEVSLMYGQYNSYATNDNNITISQSIPFFTLGSQARLHKSLLASSEIQKVVRENDLVYQVKQGYYQLAYTYALKQLLLQQDSIFEGFYRAASARYKSGETNLLEQSTAESQRNEAKNGLLLIDSDIAALRSHLQSLVNSEVIPDIDVGDLTEAPLTTSLDSTILATNPSLAFYRQQIDVAIADKKLQAAKSAPDLMVGYFNQTLIGALDPETGALANSGERFSGFQVGITIPLWFAPHHGRTRAAEFNKLAAESKLDANRRTVGAQLEQAVQSYEKTRNSLEHYRTTALPNGRLILKQSQAAFRNGEIGYAEYLLGLRNAINIRKTYLETLNNYNQSILFIEYLAGNKNN